MSPDDRARYYLAYEAAYPFGLFGRTASELDGVAEEMREVEEAADLAAAAAVLDDYEYGGDNRAAARAMRAYLGIVDPPDPADLEERLAAVERERDEALAERDAARAERDAARRLLGECYVLSGADPDGGGWEHLWPYAVMEVGELRGNYDALLRDTGDEAVIRAERDRLQAILDAERGVGGPEGWYWADGQWNREAGGLWTVDRDPCPFVDDVSCACPWLPTTWTIRFEAWTNDRREIRVVGTHPTALEAMEAADAAVRGAE